MATFSLARLAELSGVPTRTIRYYQSIGLLPKPEHAGKHAVYTAEHVARLEDISRMRTQGLQLDAIRKVFASDAYSPDTNTDWRALFNPRGRDDSDQILDDDQLSSLLGDRRDEVLDDLVSAGYVRAVDDGRWELPSLPALNGALVLYDIGTDVAVSASIYKLIQARISSLADEVVETVASAAGNGYAGEATRTELAQFMERFRAAAWENAGQTFADELERAITDLDR
jgi:DNA-binding transcriptional MerR regulator